MYYSHFSHPAHVHLHLYSMCCIWHHMLDNNSYCNLLVCLSVYQSSVRLSLHHIWSRLKYANNYVLTYIYWTDWQKSLYKHSLFPYGASLWLCWSHDFSSRTTSLYVWVNLSTTVAVAQLNPRFPKLTTEQRKKDGKLSSTSPSSMVMHPHTWPMIIYTMFGKDFAWGHVEGPIFLCHVFLRTTIMKFGLNAQQWGKVKLKQYL